MQLDAYRRFSQRLRDGLAARDDVIGLVALGSMAEIGQAPDAYSDHDFFVIASDAAAERYRASVAWLPDADAIVTWFRETAHGMKAIYDDGHLVELAVFTPDEIALARVNRYRVLLDRGDVEARMRAVHEATRAMIAREAPSDAWLVGSLVSELLVAALRDARGEHASASQRRVHADSLLWQLVARHVPSAWHDRLDDLDATRRVEEVYPAIAARLRAAAQTSARAHVGALIDITAEVLVPCLPEGAIPRAALDALRTKLAELGAP